MWLNLPTRQMKRRKVLKSFRRCVDANSSGVKLIFCPDASVSGPWSYDEEAKMLLHRRGNR